MILFSAEAILASSTSKLGMWIPLFDDEDIKSSTESTIFTSLIQCIASVGNCEQVHTSVLNLIFQQANVAGVGNLSNGDLKSAVVVGLLHNSLKSLLHWRWQNFWLTVQTGISDLDPVFVSHSFPLWMSEAALLFCNTMDSIPAGKVLKRTQLNLQKSFPIYHVCPKCLAALLCGSAFS